jgi:hypothetical protein
MKHTVRTFAAAALAWAAVLGSVPADAQTAVRRWSVSFDLGGQVAIAGDLHGGASGSVLGLPTQVSSRTYDEVYGAPFAWAAGLGYQVSDRGEIRVRGSYTSTPAERLQVGTVAGLPLLALFDDYEAFGMDVGYRQYLTDGRTRPFVGADVGFVRLQTVASEFSVPAAGVVLADVDFLESSVVPAFGFGGGLQVDVTEWLAVQGGVDVRWQGDAQDRDGLAGTGLEGINDETRRWSMPVTGGVTVRF